MSNDVNSRHWYRVKDLKPVLHDQVDIHRHDYRDQIWYLLENTTSGRSHRFNPVAYQFIGLMDGARSVEEIYRQVAERLEHHAPVQEDIIDLLSRLYEADLLRFDVSSNTEELYQRQTSQRSKKTRQRFANPVALRFALWDPEDFLNRHFRKVAWMFSKWMGLVWIVLIAWAAIEAAQHWNRIDYHFGINALSPNNLMLLFLLYPPIKFIHELGHAFSAKLEGGEVHEMGINFLLMMPVPYVNVSAASHFRDPWKRILVSAAGIMVESAVAALGLLLFLAVQPGLVQDIGFNLFLIGGISSLFFNGNPLLKYDGYYILADAVGIPNLYQRSSQYWQYLFRRYLCGLRDTLSPVSGPGEAPWFLAYSLLSLVYRLGILWFIITLVSEHFFYLGVILGIWLVCMQILLPLLRGLNYLFTSPSLQRKRARAVLASGLLGGVLVALIGFQPIPSYTVSQGVVWQPDEVRLRVEHDGFVETLMVESRQRVEVGAPLLTLYDPFLRSEARIAEARVQELRARHRASRSDDHYQAALVGEELSIAESELEFIRDKTRAMSIDAFKRGELVLLDGDDLQGRFLRKGDLLGYIIDDERPTVRMAVSQDHIGQLRQSVTGIKLRFASEPGRDFNARILRQSPEATNRLPSAALATSGGGPFIATRNERDQLETREKVFLVDLEPDFDGHEIPLGTRTWVRVNHGSETLANQWYRRLRQVFLRQLNV